jgi:hypothetical protein
VKLRAKENSMKEATKIIKEMKEAFHEIMGVNSATARMAGTLGTPAYKAEKLRITKIYQHSMEARIAVMGFGYDAECCELYKLTDL